MLQVQDIRKKASRKYADFLRAVVLGEAFFPLEIKGSKGKSTTPLEQLFPALQHLLAHSKQQQGIGYQVELKSRQTRHSGAMSLPKRIYFENEGDYVAFLNKKKEVEQFKQQVQQTDTSLPQLVDFIVAHPLKLVKELNHWADILTVAKYFLAHPKPKCYLRELPIEIHTKFIERHKGIISEVLDFILPASHYFAQEKQFEKRYGLRYDEPLIRFRILDVNSLSSFPNFVKDIALPISPFQQLQVQAQRIFIIENKQTFLAFPSVANSLAIWGKGFAVELLKSVTWLEDKQLYFWGDLDVQGFQMLHQLRVYFPQTNSLLMDKQTYQLFQHYAGKGTLNKIEQLSTLTETEQALFDLLRQQPDSSRLEQEHIPQAHLLQRLGELG